MQPATCGTDRVEQLLLLHLDLCEGFGIVGCLKVTQQQPSVAQVCESPDEVAAGTLVAVDPVVEKPRDLARDLEDGAGRDSQHGPIHDVVSRGRDFETIGHSIGDQQ